MSGRVLALDTVLSATFHFVRKWSPDLTRNQSRDLLRLLLCRLYDQGRGNVVCAQLTLAQGTLAQKLGLSRQWVGILVSRLADAGWIEFSAPWVGEGMQGSTVFRAGRLLKRLLIMLLKSKLPETPTKSAAKPKWHFSPSHEEKKILLIQEKERQPVRPALLDKIPLLQTWMNRGEESPMSNAARA